MTTFEEAYKKVPEAIYVLFIYRGPQTYPPSNTFPEGKTYEGAWELFNKDSLASGTFLTAYKYLDSAERAKKNKVDGRWFQDGIIRKFKLVPVEDDDV